MFCAPLTKISMPIEMLVGLNVIDDARYQEYRRSMAPILESYGGGFGYDFRISEVLRSQTDDPINRVFTIRFPDQERKRRFFSDAAYAEVKAAHFDGSVGHTTIIATYET